MGVGAVIIDSCRRVLGQGYNGFPRGVNDSPERYEDRSFKYPVVVHAEVNAILNAAHDLRGATIYSTCIPCPNCAGVLIQAGITKVFYPATPPLQSIRASAGKTDWRKMGNISKTMFGEARVHWSEIAWTPKSYSPVIT